MAARLAEEWFAICGGCEVTILDIGEPLIDLLKQVEIVHMPVLMDHKLFGQTGEKAEMEIPEADVGLISGGIRNEEHKKLAQEMRRKCKTLIALGSCACYGGIPALANLSTTQELLNNGYRESVTTDTNGIPDQEIPALTDRVYALSEVVPVDMMPPRLPDHAGNGGRRSHRAAGGPAVYAGRPRAYATNARPSARRRPSRR